MGPPEWANGQREGCLGAGEVLARMGVRLPEAGVRDVVLLNTLQNCCPSQLSHPKPGRTLFHHSLRLDGEFQQQIMHRLWIKGCECLRCAPGCALQQTYNGQPKQYDNVWLNNVCTCQLPASVGLMQHSFLSAGVSAGGHMCLSSNALLGFKRVGATGTDSSVKLCWKPCQAYTMLCAAPVCVATVHCQVNYDLHGCQN